MVDHDDDDDDARCLFVVGSFGSDVTLRERTGCHAVLVATQSTILLNLGGAIAHTEPYYSASAMEDIDVDTSVKTIVGCSRGAIVKA
jgi:hypothetical protein